MVSAICQTCVIRCRRHLVTSWGVCCGLAWRLSLGTGAMALLKVLAPCTFGETFIVNKNATDIRSDLPAKMTTTEKVTSVFDVVYNNSCGR